MTPRGMAGVILSGAVMSEASHGGVEASLQLSVAPLFYSPGRTSVSHFVRQAGPQRSRIGRNLPFTAPDAECSVYLCALCGEFIDELNPTIQPPPTTPTNPANKIPPS